MIISSFNKKSIIKVVVLSVTFLIFSKSFILSQSIVGSWIPIEVEKNNELSISNHFYDFGLTFPSDSSMVFHNYLLDFEEETSMQIVNNEYIQFIDRYNETRKIKILKLTLDSLYLNYLSTDEKNGTQINYIKPTFRSTTITTENLKFTLLSKYWKYSIDSLDYRIEFQFGAYNKRRLSDPYNKPYSCILHIYNQNEYERSIELEWNVVIHGNIVLLYLYDYAYYFEGIENFYLNYIESDKKSIRFVGWYQNKKHEISFQSEEINQQSWYDYVRFLCSKNWVVKSLDIPKDEINLGILDSSWENAKFLTLKDFEKDKLSYKFNDNYTFQLFRKNKVLATGEWKLYPNQDFIELNFDNTVVKHPLILFDSYISIMKSDKSQLKIKKYELLSIDDIQYHYKTYQVWE